MIIPPKKLFYCFLVLFFCCSLRLVSAQESASTPVPFDKVITVEAFSPFFGQLTLGYEKIMGKNITKEIKLGLIGLGFERQFDKLIFEQKGVFLRYGLKFYKYKNPRLSLLSDGYYRIIKPEIYMGVKQVYVHDDGDFSQESLVFFSGLLINYGRKIMISDDFCFGWDIGIGYSIIRSENTMNSVLGLPITPSFIRVNEGMIGPVLSGNRRFPIALSAGLNLGYVF